MSPLFHLFTIFCGLAAVAFAPAAAPRWYLAPVLAASFGVTLAGTGAGRVPDPVGVGTLAAVTAVLLLWRPGFFPLAAIAAGALAAVLVPLLVAAGMPFRAAAALAAGIPAVSMLLASRRAGFAPLPVQEEALLLVAGLGLMVAAGPEVLEGWRSARVLNLEYETGGPGGVSRAVLVIGTAAIVLGGCYTLWWRRR